MVIADVQRIFVIEQIIQPQTEEVAAARRVDVGDERSVERAGDGCAVAVERTPLGVQEERKFLGDQRPAEVELKAVLIQIGFGQREGIARIERRVARIKAERAAPRVAAGLGDDVNPPDARRRGFRRERILIDADL